MKKSIKYAGIAAATLLTVAPIAAPVVSNVTTVQAAGTDATSASALKKAISDFDDSFGDIDSSTIGENFVLSNANNSDNNKMNLTDFQSKELSTLGSPTLKVADLLTASTADNDANIRDFYVTATANGKEVNNLTDLQTYLDDSDYTVVYTVHYTYTDTNQQNQTGTVDVKIKGDDTVDLSSVNASYTTPLTVAKKTTVTSTQLIGSGTVKLTDQNGDGIVAKSVQPQATYYNTYAGAMSGDKSALATDALDTTATPNKFDKAGTYYQPITVTFSYDSALNKFITKYNNDPSSNPIKVNGVVATPGYDFAYTLGNQGPAVTSVGADGKVIEREGTQPVDGTLTFVRKVVVSDSESQWTVKDTTGVVTTKSDSSFYTLKNGENNTISDRALAKNTAWKTNAVRTDQLGNKQYRVGADEWIDANNVTFSDKATDNNGEGAYTDVKALNGKVTTAGPEGFYYPLYDDNGKMVTNRGVAGLSAWYTDKSAVNADGVTVYHVATGEWLQGTNVTYTAY